MAKLHIFNPEHDIALASNLANFTAPHAGRQLRNDLGFLPMLWADEGDVVLVDDVASAERSWRRVRSRIATCIDAGRLQPPNTSFAASKQPVCSLQTTRIEPWGWDKALCAALKRQGISPSLLPNSQQLEAIRQQSHRRLAAHLLPSLRIEGTVGEAFECTSEEAIANHLQHYGRIVLKAPWSSSGRGIRFCDASLPSDPGKTANDNRWLQNLLQRQGSVMVEPYYNKVKDFGMEFHVDDSGIIHYDGLSLFHTVNGAYTGNILATEQTKREMISRYIPANLLDNVQELIISRLSLKNYVGPFGVDMMVVADESRFLLHPCVEINLRRTMGHVALAISPTDDDIVRVMRIVYNGTNYQLKIQHL